MLCTINNISCSKTTCFDINIYSTLLHFASKCKVMSKQLVESTSCFDITLHFEAKSATRQCCWHTHTRSVLRKILFLLGLQFFFILNFNLSKKMLGNNIATTMKLLPLFHLGIGMKVPSFKSTTKSGFIPHSE